MVLYLKTHGHEPSYVERPTSPYDTQKIFSTKGIVAIETNTMKVKKNHPLLTMLKNCPETRRQAKSHDWITTVRYGDEARIKELSEKFLQLLNRGEGRADSMAKMLSHFVPHQNNYLVHNNISFEWPRHMSSYETTFKFLDGGISFLVEGFRGVVGGGSKDEASETVVDILQSARLDSDSDSTSSTSSSSSSSYSSLFSSPITVDPSERGYKEDPRYRVMFGFSEGMRLVRFPIAPSSDVLMQLILPTCSEQEQNLINMMKDYGTLLQMSSNGNRQIIFGETPDHAITRDKLKKCGDWLGHNLMGLVSMPNLYHQYNEPYAHLNMPNVSFQQGFEADIEYMCKFFSKPVSSQLYVDCEIDSDTSSRLDVKGGVVVQGCQTVNINKCGVFLTPQKVFYEVDMLNKKTKLEKTVKVDLHIDSPFIFLLLRGTEILMAGQYSMYH